MTYEEYKEFKDRAQHFNLWLVELEKVIYSYKERGLDFVPYEKKREEILKALDDVLTEWWELCPILSKKPKVIHWKPCKFQARVYQMRRIKERENYNEVILLKKWQVISYLGVESTHNSEEKAILKCAEEQEFLDNVVNNYNRLADNSVRSGNLLREV